MFRYFFIFLFFILSTSTFADRIKDISSIEGVRKIDLIGYGLVVGLTGTGDSSSSFTESSMKNMLSKMGVPTQTGKTINSKNVAAVMVTAKLNPFSRVGTTTDVSVSSIGNAKSLRGGQLLMTPLKAVDGNTYAVAQGSLISGGLSAEGKDGSSITVNIPSNGSIPNGANIERELTFDVGQNGKVNLLLHRPDYMTSSRVSEVINNTFGKGVALSLDSGTIQVMVPKDKGQRVEFLAMLTDIKVQPGKAPAKIVINSKTGTIVIGSEVKVSPAAVSHGSLVVKITESSTAYQPNAFAGGSTATTTNSTPTIDDKDNRMFVFNEGVSLSQIVKSINNVGASPSDLMAILEALKAVGALRAQIIVI